MQRGNERCIGAASENRDDAFERGRISHAKAVDELRFEPAYAQVRIDGAPSPVNDDDALACRQAHDRRCHRLHRR
jgi:hypothetical protein